MPKEPLLVRDVRDVLNNIRYPVSNPTTSSTAKTSTSTLSTTNVKWTNLTNLGAGGDIVLTLPAANSVGLYGFRVYIAAAHAVNLSPIATDAVYLAGSGVVNKDLVIAGTIGNYADLYSDGTYWHCYGHSGVVTKES